MGALVAEYGGALLKRSENQRIADMSSFAGGARLCRHHERDQQAKRRQERGAAQRIPSTAVTVTLGNSPKTMAPRRSASASRSRSRCFLAKVSVQPDEPEHRHAGTGRGRQRRGGRRHAGLRPGAQRHRDRRDAVRRDRITAAECSVSSNNTVTVPCGNLHHHAGLNYNSAAAPTIGCSGVTAPSGKTLVIAKKATTDPLAGNTAVASALARVTAVAGLVTPSTPSANRPPYRHQHRFRLGHQVDCYECRYRRRLHGRLV